VRGTPPMSLLAAGDANDGIERAPVRIVGSRVMIVMSTSSSLQRRCQILIVPARIFAADQAHGPAGERVKACDGLVGIGQERT
jgi:hypothetical protein